MTYFSLQQQSESSSKNQNNPYTERQNTEKVSNFPKTISSHNKSVWITDEIQFLSVNFNISLFTCKVVWTFFFVVWKRAYYNIGL